MKMLPDPGDTVEIVIDPSVPVNQGAERFACRVVEEGFRGTGFLDRMNINRSNNAIPVTAFLDEMNRPLRLRARVMACSRIDDSLSFSIIDELNRFINTNVEVGAEVTGVVMAMPAADGGYNSDRFTVLTEHGYTVWLDGAEFTDELFCGQTVGCASTPSAPVAAPTSPPHVSAAIFPSA